MVQIAIIDFYNQKICMIGWVNSWAICRPTQFTQSMIREFALEVQAEVDGPDLGDTFSEAGSTAAPNTMAGGVWQAPSSSGGTWSSSASSSASSSTGGSTAVSSS